VVGLGLGAALIGFTDSGAWGPTMGAILISNLITVAVYRWSDGKVRAELIGESQTGDPKRALVWAIRGETVLYSW
jgi:hypothetical protein